MAAAVHAADTAECRHVACQDAVLFSCDNQDRPVVALEMLLNGSRAAGAAGFGDVEREDAAWAEGFIDPTEEARQRSPCISLIEQVVEDLAHGGDGIAVWQACLEKGSTLKGRLGAASAGYLEHGGGLVDAMRRISSVEELTHPEAAAAAEFHDEPLCDAALAQQRQKGGTDAAGVKAETGVVNVRQVILIAVGHGGALQLRMRVGVQPLGWATRRQAAACTPAYFFRAASVIWKWSSGRGELSPTVASFRRQFSGPDVYGSGGTVFAYLGVRSFSICGSLPSLR